MSTNNNNRSESSRGLSSKEIGKRDLGIKKGTSKASKLLGYASEEILNSSTSNLNSSDTSDKSKRGSRFFRRHSSSEMIDSTSTGGRNSTNSATSSTASR